MANQDIFRVYIDIDYHGESVSFYRDFYDFIEALKFYRTSCHRYSSKFIITLVKVISRSKTHIVNHGTETL